MIVKKYITQLLNSIFILMFLLFMIDALFILEIKSQVIKTFAYIGIMILAPIIIGWNSWFFTAVKHKIMSILFPLLILILIVLIGPLKIIFTSSAWTTNKVLYQNKYTPSKKVEFQLQDIGALGYNRRTVEVRYFTPWFMLTSPVQNDIDKHPEWLKSMKNN